MQVLPQEIIEWVASGMDFCDHFVEVGAQFVYAGFVFCRDEYARGVFLGDPAVLEFIEGVVFRPFRL